MSELLEGILGGGGGKSNALGDMREAVVGGCWGIVMSGAFFFVFFFTLITVLVGNVEGTNLQIGGAALPAILLVCISAPMSPLIGILMGLRGGQYSMTRHFGCFGIWLGLLIIAIAWLSGAI